MIAIFEARIFYDNNKKHTVQANTIEMLKSKCKPYIDNPKVLTIEVVKTTDIGWFKHPFDIEIL